MVLEIRVYFILPERRLSWGENVSLTTRCLLCLIFVDYFTYSYSMCHTASYYLLDCHKTSDCDNDSMCNHIYGRYHFMYVLRLYSSVALLFYAMTLYVDFLFLLCMYFMKCALSEMTK